MFDGLALILVYSHHEEEDDEDGNVGRKETETTT
jgi:hypothetical protein